MIGDNTNLTKFYTEEVSEKQKSFLLKHKDDIGFNEKFIDEISSKEASSLIGNFIKCKELKRKMIEDNKKKVQDNNKELLNNKFFENQNKELELLYKIDENLANLIKEVKMKEIKNRE